MILLEKQSPGDLLETPNQATSSDLRVRMNCRPETSETQRHSRPLALEMVLGILSLRKLEFLPSSNLVQVWRGFD